MRDELKAALLQATVTVTQGKIEAMKADNLVALARQQIPPHSASSFLALIEPLEKCITQIKE